MALAREDRRFVVGLGAAVALTAVYLLGVRAPLRSATARAAGALRALQGEADRYFRSPDATAFDEAQRELGRRMETLDRRLRELTALVAFDAGAVGGTAGAAGDPADAYVALSAELHARIRAAAERAPQSRIPAVFDPQGAMGRPADPAAIPRLRRQLVMAYLILDAAIDHGVGIEELRPAAPPLAEAAALPYLDEAAVTVSARGSLDAVAAWLHALGQPPRGGGSTFLSIAGLAVNAGPGTNAVDYSVTFASVRVRPDVVLAGPPARSERDGGRAPIY